VRTLSSDPAALSATDARGLAAAAANLTVVNITSTEQAISMLITSLGGCLSMYREMNGVMAGVRDDIQAGRDRDAAEKLLEADDKDVGYPSHVGCEEMA
jgi:hypothetical protein